MGMKIENFLVFVDISLFSFCATDTMKQVC